ncbi:MAG: hypothetical protein RLY86_2250 [Pseudomonadota bacterium]
MGKALVDLLEQGGQEDITAHWMAHYLAELMERARTATGPERQHAQTEAKTLVLNLWRHRTYLPGRYPLASFEPVLRTLDRLSGGASWHRLSSPPIPDSEAPGVVLQWLRRAEAINEASKTAIRSCLQRAVTAAAESEETWLDLLNDLPKLDDDTPAIIIRIIASANHDDIEEEIKQEKLRAALDALDLLRRELT